MRVSLRLRLTIIYGALFLAAGVFLLGVNYALVRRSVPARIKVTTVREAPAGTTWAVGTEVHLVHRLAEEVAPEKLVLSLDQMGCLCSTMFRVSPNHLLWVLEGLVEGRVHNEIVVPETQQKFAKLALNRMLTIQ